MPRLFVAVDLPATALAELVRIQPPPVEGIRMPDATRMHLTLHFIGEADIERIAAALGTVAVPAFHLTLGGVGKFRSADGGLILWAGVLVNAELSRLHAAVAAALAREGFRPETRRYAPHITLARCKRGVSSEVVNGFLNRNADFSLPDLPIAEFRLYSSALGGGPPVYRCEQSFPLLPSPLPPLS